MAETPNEKARKAHQFKPGQSGNPKGRPPDPNFREFKKWMQETANSEKVYNRIIEHLENPDITTKDLVQLVQFIRDSGFGKPAPRNYSDDPKDNPYQGGQQAQPIVLPTEVIEYAKNNDKKSFKNNDEKED